MDGGWLVMLNTISGLEARQQVGSQAHLLRVYASLTAQGTRPLSPGSIPFSRLAPSQVGYLRTHLNAHHSYTNFDPESAKQFTTRLSRDKSELMPNGIPDSGSFSFGIERQTGLIGFDAATNGTRFLKPIDLAALMVHAETPYYLQQYGEPQKFASYQVAEKTNFLFDFPILRGVSISTKANGGSPRREGNPVSYAQLPKAIRDQVDAYVGLIKQR